MLISRRAFWTLFIMTAFAAIYNLWLPMHPDESVYWQWSRHLAWSYFDGPPMMAYLIRLFTTLFGQTAFAVKLTAVCCVSTGAFFMYRLARELFNENVAYTALLVLLFIPITQSGYVISTLDPALFCFWSIALYYFYVALARQRTRYIYLTAMALGCAVLSKYTGVLLGVALFLYIIISKEHRKELKNIHWYLGVLVALLIFSPVIIWNWQHHFAAFSYQYNHGVASQKTFQWSLMFYFISTQMAVTNPIFFGGIFYCLIRYWKTIWKNEKLRYAATPFLVTFGFFFYQALFQLSLANWAVPAYISATILLSYCLVEYHKKILYRSMMILSIILVMLVRFPWLTPFLPGNIVMISKFLGYPQLFSQANEVYQPGELVLSDSPQTASEAAFYLTGQPQTYILDDTREYQYWNTAVLEQIKSRKITSAIFICDPDNIYRITPFFKNTKLIRVLEYKGRWSQKTLLMYRVWN